MTYHPADVLSEPPDEPVVHWMERPSMSVGATGEVILPPPPPEVHVVI